MPSERSFQTVVIGAGQAGLAMSRTLQRYGVQHVVLEKGRIGESWRSSRWDSFCLNTPNQTLRLPDGSPPEPAEGFLSRDQFIGWLESYCKRFDLPVLENTPVTAVHRRDGHFEVQANRRSWSGRSLVVCTGDQNAPVLPPFAPQVDVHSLHVSRYRNPSLLPAGGVLVVGSGQSGIQVVEDLLDAGRTVWLSTSMVGRAVRRYRGQDVISWFQDAGFYLDPTHELILEERRLLKQPQFTGVDGGRTVSLHSLARRGAKLIGRITNGDGKLLEVDGDLGLNARWGDDFSAQVKAMIDGHIAREGIDAPPAKPDPDDLPSPLTLKNADLRQLDLQAQGVSSIVWATGFTGKFDFLPDRLRSTDGLPIHDNGIGPWPGLYYLGLTWLRSRGSGLVLGVAQDADAIGRHLLQRLASVSNPPPPE